MSRSITPSPRANPTLDGTRRGGVSTVAGASASAARSNSAPSSRSAASTCHRPGARYDATRFTASSTAHLGGIGRFAATRPAVAAACAAAKVSGRSLRRTSAARSPLAARLLAARAAAAASAARRSEIRAEGRRPTARGSRGAVVWRRRWTRPRRRLAAAASTSGLAGLGALRVHHHGFAGASVAVRLLEATLDARGDAVRAGEWALVLEVAPERRGDARAGARVRPRFRGARRTRPRGRGQRGRRGGT